VAANQIDSALNELNRDCETAGCEFLWVRHIDKLAVDLRSLQIGVICGSSIPSREAGASIKPRVERGFASGTLGSGVLEKFQPAKRATDNRFTQHVDQDRCGFAFAVARFAGFNHLLRSRS